MKESLLKHSGVTLLATGPLTDVACLIESYPEVLDGDKITEVVALMGRAEGASLKLSVADDVKVTDFNFLRDKEAAKIVLGQDKVPVRLLTFPVSSSLYIPFDFIPYPPVTDDELPKFLSEKTKAWVDYFDKNVGLEVKGFYPWDTHVVNYLIEPKSYTCKKSGYKIQDCSDTNSKCQDHNDKTQLWFSDEYKDGPVHTFCTDFAEDAKARLMGHVLKRY